MLCFWVSIFTFYLGYLILLFLIFVTFLRSIKLLLVVANALLCSPAVPKPLVVANVLLCSPAVPKPLVVANVLLCSPAVPKLGAAKVIASVAGLRALGVWCVVCSVSRNFVMEK